MIAEIRKKIKELHIINDFEAYLTRFDGKQGIVRCNHLDKDTVITLICSIKNISDNPVKIKTLGTSGTIKSLVKKHMDSSL